MTDTEPTALVNVNVPASPLAIIAAAVERGADPDQLEKLLALQERFERNEAAKAFSEAMTEFQDRMPAVFKRRAATGKIQFSYASYDDVMRDAKPHLKHCGLVPTYTTDPVEPNSMRITCRIRKGIHCEESSVTIKGATGTVQGVQLDVQTVTFGKRVALCLALGIVTTDEDMDGNDTATIGNAELDELRTLIAEKGVDLDRFLAWANVHSLADILRKDFPKALDTLQRRKAGAK